MANEIPWEAPEVSSVHATHPKMSNLVAGTIELDPPADAEWAGVFADKEQHPWTHAYPLPDVSDGAVTFANIQREHVPDYIGRVKERILDTSKIVTDMHTQQAAYDTDQAARDAEVTREIRKLLGLD